MNVRDIFPIGVNLKSLMKAQAPGLVSAGGKTVSVFGIWDMNKF
jgi:hypothetical protein